MSQESPGFSRGECQIFAIPFRETELFPNDFFVRHILWVAFSDIRKYVAHTSVPTIIVRLPPLDFLVHDNQTVQKSKRIFSCHFLLHVLLICADNLLRAFRPACEREVAHLLLICARRIHDPPVH